MDHNETISVLVVEPGKTPYEKQISSGLESLQREVGGYIEAVYPYEEPVALLCDEEGKLNGKEWNRALRDDEGNIYDVVAGTFLIVGLGDENFGSLSDEHMEKFKDRFGCYWIKCTCCLITQQHIWICGKCSCYGNSLFLSAR